MADRALLEQVAPSPTFITYTYPVHDQAPSVHLALGAALLVPSFSSRQLSLRLCSCRICSAVDASSVFFRLQGGTHAC